MKNRPMELDAGALCWARSPMSMRSCDSQLLTSKSCEKLLRTLSVVGHAHGLAEDIAVILLPAADDYMVILGWITVSSSCGSRRHRPIVSDGVANSGLPAHAGSKVRRNARSTSPHVTPGSIVSSVARKPLDHRMVHPPRPSRRLTQEYRPRQRPTIGVAEGALSSKFVWQPIA